MSSEVYGFVTVNDHDDLHENGQLTFGVAAHTGRSGRSKGFDLDADHGGHSHVDVVQQAAGYIMVIDHFEDENGNTVQTIGDPGGLYYMCGYANVDYLVASEVVDTLAQTDLNDQSTGVAWVSGFSITEASGTTHSGVQFGTSISYGTDAQYTFKIPVTFQKTNERIEVQFQLSDNVHTVTGSVVQDAPASSGGDNAS